MLLLTIVVGAIFGVTTLLCVLFGIQDLAGVLGTSTGLVIWLNRLKLSLIPENQVYLSLKSVVAKGVLSRRHV